MLALLLFVVAAQTDAGVAAAQPVRLASPGLAYVELNEQKGALFADHLAKQLELQGLKVTGKSEMAALLGFERQRQLMGCSDESTSSCLAELAGALGADGVLTGTLGKVGSGYVANLKIVSSDGKSLAIASGRVAGDDQLLDWLAATAADLAAQMTASLGRAPLVPIATVRTAVPAVVTLASERPKWWVAPVVVGVAAVVGGGVFLFLARWVQGELNRGGDRRFTDPDHLDAFVASGRTYERLGWALGVSGLALVAGGVAVAVFTRAPANVPVAIVPGPDGALLVFSGAWP